MDGSRPRTRSPESWSGFYTAAEVARLAQVPARTLREWQQREIIKPSIHLEDEDGKEVNGYSYADLTIIRMLRLLREDRIDFTSAGAALDHLYQRLGPPSAGWADAHVYFIGAHIYAWQPDEWQVTEATRHGQRVETRVFGDLFDDIRELEKGSSIVVPEQFRPFVQINPNLMGGEPVVRGSRVPTGLLCGLHRAGRSIIQLAREYGHLSRKAIEKAVEYETFLDMAAAPASAVPA